MTQIDRADLHARLDDLLASTDPNTDGVDAVLFWSFIADVARGRGIDRELTSAATDMIAEHGLPPEPVGLWKAYQGAILFKLLRRLDLGKHGSVLPEGFAPSGFYAHALNLVRGKRVLPDILQVGGRKLGHKSMASLAQLQIVAAVAFRAEKDNISEAEARRLLLPPPGHPTEKDREGKGFYRTWANWKKLAEDQGWIERAQAAARDSLPAASYEHDEQTLEELWEFAMARLPK